MPKYIVNGAGDEFFLPDSSQMYFDDLTGPKYLRYVPNVDHSLNLDAAFSMVGFYQAIENEIPLPEFTWSIDPDGSIRVQTLSGSPASILLWQANNPDARDFRLETIGAAWTSVPLVDQGGGVYLGQIPSEQGYNAYFVELTYNTAPNMLPLTFTTSVYVVPEPVSVMLLLSGIGLSFVRRKKHC